MVETPVREKTHVIVRAYPKVVYLYLTWLASIICGFLQPGTLFDVEAGTLVDGAMAQSALIGRIWLGIFVFNILVIAFEFSRIRSVAIVFFLLAFFFAASKWEVVQPITDFVGGLNLVMNKSFYWTMAAVFTVIFLLVFINTRFSYWEIQPNEILHHHGFLGDIHRYPVRGLRMQKEITDVLELILLRAGTLVMTPVGVERPIVLENVINITKVEDKIQRLLGTMKVHVDHGQIGGTD
jgi:hypothetical protein